MKKSIASKNVPLVSVIILNWNRPHDTVECVASIKEQTYSSVETIVVDNGSIDNSKEILKKLDDIILVENPTNRGFTGGHIDGLEFATGTYVFVLNNDAVVDKNYISNAVAILEKDESIAVVGGRSYQWETPEQIFQDTSPFFAFQTINRFSMEGIFKRSDSGYDHEVNWVSGSAMVIRKSALEKSGYFYDPMFAYYEESDLFARIQAANYTIVYSPSLKIWHKNGASSSSYFQYYQLFKNRFVYGMRNLSSTDLTRFIKSYTKTTLRGSYHHVTGRSTTDDEKVMNRALHNALGHSVATWPRWASSRKTATLKDGNGLTLNNRLKIEQTGISFICDISGDISSVKKLVDFIKATSFKHYNSETILVCKPSEENKLQTLLEQHGLLNLGVKIATDTHQSSTSPLNIGWLSSSKEFVWFITPTYQPDIELINKTCLVIGDKPLSLYVETPHQDMRHAKEISVTENFCASRQLLALSGGIVDNSLTTSLAYIYYLSTKLAEVSVHTEEPATKDLSQPYMLTNEVQQSIKLVVHAYRDQQRKTSRYSKMLERYYRLYQLHNLSTWLFVGGIPHRHKLARIRNSLLATIRLQRKELATELKHISNEVIKTKHSGFDKEEREGELESKVDHALTANGWKNTPIFIICRDRVSPLKDLLKWLEAAGMKNIILVDNDSLYPGLVTFFEETPYQVIRTGKNTGHTVVWNEGIAKTLFPGQYYIVTDPDVIPDTKAPKDSVKYFYELHKKYIEYQKVGFGLQIDDLPDHYKLKDYVVEWESQFWKNELERDVFEAGVDTTFALYKPYTDYYTLHPSIRTGRPYTAQHLPWYVNSSLIDPEEAYYRMRASQDITSWNTDEILERYKKEFTK